jgi:hypothetical protein
MLTFVLSGFMLAHSNVVYAQSLENEGWELVFDKDNIQVHRRLKPASDLVEILTIATIYSSPEKVFSVITDYASYPEFMPHIVESRVVRHENNSQEIFQRVRISEFFRFLFKDRYHVVINHLTYPEPDGNHYRVEWTINAAATKELEIEGAIATSLNTGYWDIQGINDNQETRIHYYLHTDPGGLIPKNFVNSGTTKSIPAVINAVRDRVNSQWPG